MKQHELLKKFVGVNFINATLILLFTIVSTFTGFSTVAAISVGFVILFVTMANTSRLFKIYKMYKSEMNVA